MTDQKLTMTERPTDDREHAAFIHIAETVRDLGSMMSGLSILSNLAASIAVHVGMDCETWLKLCHEVYHGRAKIDGAARAASEADG